MQNPDEVKVQLEIFGRDLRRARVARAMTQEVLSEKADLNIRTLQKIEAGQTNVLVTTVMRLQEALGCPWHELLPTTSPAPQKRLASQNSPAPPTRAPASIPRRA